MSEVGRPKRLTSQLTPTTSERRDQWKHSTAILECKILVSLQSLSEHVNLWPCSGVFQKTHLRLLEVEIADACKVLSAAR